MKFHEREMYEQSMNHISLNKARPIPSHPTAQNTFQSIPGLISCTAVHIDLMARKFMVVENHRCLQSCVGTWERLGYAAFDAQLRKSVFCHYIVCYTYICVCMCYMLVTMCLRVLSSWYEKRMIRNNSGNARACRCLCGEYEDFIASCVGSQRIGVPMYRFTMSRMHHLWHSIH